MNPQTILYGETISKPIRFRSGFGISIFALIILIVVTLVSEYFLKPQMLERGYDIVKNHLIHHTNNDFRVYSTRLNDKLVNYYSRSCISGIPACKDEKELKYGIVIGNLMSIPDGIGYTKDKMKHSYPYLTSDTRLLLEEIGKRFSAKISKNRLKQAKFIVTSMTRTIDTVEELRQTNANVSLNSPHLNGNAFDITYIRFKTNGLIITDNDKRCLKETLAETIWELRREKKCWATHERCQNCFHIVAR